MTRTRSSRAARVTTEAKTDAQRAALLPAQEKNKPAKSQAASVSVHQPSELQPDGLRPDASASPLPRGIKQRLVLDLLQRNGGATLGELTAATSWLPHTTRAALTRLRQSGYEVTRSRREDGVCAYICTGGALGDGAQAS